MNFSSYKFTIVLLITFQHLLFLTISEMGIKLVFYWLIWRWIMNNVHTRSTELNVILKQLKLDVFSERASWVDYILITSLMHWLLFVHKILFSSTCFEPQVLIFRRIQLYTCSIWYCHSRREWQYHMLHVYNCILLKMSTGGSKHVEENSILWINNNQCIKLVINIYSIEACQFQLWN